MPLAMPYMYGGAYGMPGAGMYAGMYGAQAGAVAGGGFAGAIPGSYTGFQGNPASTSGAGGGMMGHPQAMAGMYPQGVAMGYYGMPAMMPAAGPAAGPGPGTAAAAAASAGGSGGGDIRHRSPWRAVVHNLPWETTNTELLEAFNLWNPQSAHIMKDRKTGYSKCAPSPRQVSLSAPGFVNGGSSDVPGLPSATRLRIDFFRIDLCCA